MTGATQARVPEPECREPIPLHDVPDAPTMHRLVRAAVGTLVPPGRPVVPARRSLNAVTRRDGLTRLARILGTFGGLATAAAPIVVSTLAGA